MGGHSLCYPLVIVGLNGRTLSGNLEGGQRKLLGHDSDIEVNQAGSGHIHPDFLDREPEEQILGSDSVQLLDLTVTQSAGNIDIVVDLVLEHGVAGLIQIHFKPAVAVKGEVGDAVGKQAHGEPVGFENLVYRGWLPYRHARERTQEKSQQKRMQHG